MDTSFKKSFLKTGIIIALLSILFSMTVYILNANLSSSVMKITSFLVNVIIAIIPIIWFGRQYRDAHLNGYMDYGKAVLYGIMSILVASVFVTLYNYIFLSVAGEDYKEMLMQQAMESVYNNPTLSEEDIDKAYDMIEGLIKNTGLQTLMTFIGFIFSGAIYSVIAAIFIKKKEEVFS